MPWTKDQITQSNLYSRCVARLTAFSQSISGSGVRMLTTQKPIKGQVWWKGKFALFQASNWGGGRLLSKDQLPSPSSPDNQGARAFIDRGRRLPTEIAQLALIVLLKLVISSLISVILIKNASSLVPGSVCSHFLHGYSLLIM